MKLRGLPALGRVIATSCALLLPLSIHAAAITGGTTTVTFNTSTLSVLTGAGFTISPVSPATLVTSPATAAIFPITGGDTTTNITHSGGLNLTRNATTASLTSFNINLTNNTLFGNVAAGGSTFSNVPLFDITSVGGATTLGISSTLASQINAVFGVPIPAGTPIGTAAIAASAVPEPGSIALGALGLLGVFGAARARRRATA